MYIKKVDIENIRSFSELKIDFPDGSEAGWHVLLGDNGAGKSTILKAIAMGLIGPTNVLRLNPAWESYVRKGSDFGLISVKYIREEKEELPPEIRSKNLAHIELKVVKDNPLAKYELVPFKINWEEASIPSHSGKRFSCAIGPFRRFSLNEPSRENTPVTPYITLFDPEITMSSTLAYMKDQHLRALEKDVNSQLMLTGIKELLNGGGLLPNNLQLERITADGIFFRDGEKLELQLHDLSDGIKSILSLILELLRLMSGKYSAEEIFGRFEKDKIIPTPGVVLIDEIDAHLHPTWQTRIGQWFTQYFPNLQFIVTTHSPLICRACEKGSIYRLAAPGSQQVSGPILGEEKDRLVYGDVLDAYDTEVFGANITIGMEGQAKQEEYRNLVYKENYGLKLNQEEKKQLKHLKSIFHTDVEVDQ